MAMQSLGHRDHVAAFVIVLPHRLVVQPGLRRLLWQSRQSAQELMLDLRPLHLAALLLLLLLILLMLLLLLLLVVLVDPVLVLLVLLLCCIVGAGDGIVEISTLNIFRESLRFQRSSLSLFYYWFTNFAHLHVYSTFSIRRLGSSWL